MWSQFSRSQRGEKKEGELTTRTFWGLFYWACAPRWWRIPESGGDGFTKTEVEECSKVQQSQNIKRNTWPIINGFISVRGDQSAGSCFPLSTLIPKPARHYPDTSPFLRAWGGVLCTMYIFDSLFFRLYSLCHTFHRFFLIKKKKIHWLLFFFISASFLSELCQFNIQREKAQLQTKGNFPPVHICLRGRRALTPGSNKRPTLGEKIR